MKKIKVLITALAITTLTTFPVFAEWKQEGDGRWWYQNEDGGYPASQWMEIDGKQYYFDAEGYMLTNATAPDGKQVGKDGVLIQTQKPSEIAEISYQGVEGIEILADYTLPDGIGWYTRHFLVIKNNSNSTVKVSTSSMAYSKEGNIVSSADGSIDALGPGCVSVMYEAFETSANIDHYNTAINVSKSKYYESVIQDLTYVKNDITDGAVFQVTNNGQSPADFVQGYALYYLKNELVGYEFAYFVDDDSELKPGATISKQLKSYQKFDRTEFYLNGRR